jgi:hypothetical protein
MNDVHVDSLLTNISVAYMQDQSNFIADKVFPVVSVAKQSDVYRTFSKSDFLRIDSRRIGPGAMAPESGFGLADTLYSCNKYGLAAMADEQTAANHDNIGHSLEELHAMNLMQDLLMNRESQWMTAFFANSIWGTTLTTPAADRWSVSTSDPKALVNTGKETILGSTGKMPNTLVLDYRVFNALTEHPLVRDQFKYVGSGSVNEAMLQGFFDVERVFVAKSISNTSVEGASSPSYGLASGQHALLCYSTPTPSLVTPSAGYIFQWDGVTGGLINGVRTERFDVPERHGVKIEVNSFWDMATVSTDCGYFFLNVTA